jgi:hypothetical protein
MPLTKVTKSGISNDAIDADKIEDGTIVAADITPGTITADKLNSTLDLSSKTVTLANSTVTNAQLAGSIANAKLANSSVTINGTSVSLGSSISAGSLQWQSVQTSGFTAVAGRGYFCNTSSAAFTVTLPASATIGDTIALVDYAGTFATYKLTIDRNGHNIQGVANNSQIGTNRASVTLVYVDSTKGWVYQDESNVADLQGPAFISATGGTITTSGNFKIHSFTGDGSFVVSQVGNPVGGGSNVDYLVVAGGGGGAPGQGWGNANSGGGGAGGFREGRVLPAPESYTASPLVAPGGLPVSVTTYPVTVGGGGPGGSSCTAGGAPSSNGSNSIFSTITSTGGGYGAGAAFYPSNTNGGSGGSGGGGTVGPPGGGTGNAGSGNTPPVSPPQGNNGGPWSLSATGGAGGGGGATTSGFVCGPGGNGATTSISGSPTTYAGGGGGGNDSTIGAGGTGGGGNGKYAVPSLNSATSGGSNTGGGGGGAGINPKSVSPVALVKQGAAGGKGIVIIRYKYQ